ncbi:MlaD family protein [Mycobacteroides chelonae]|uniref:Mammalian cell entry protein n=1 Tax=Mycobacteroides chelonae TaxID=1774 RepID=A0A1S1M8H6_MYCCH|nr:MCE family protein [Mycobacteroides chelonae]OHU78215.1 mammalian cell entry protein [Mycobacteroides chelonae]QQG86598.1 MCE family protein [Mycobacteroides chelonae]QQG91415.1 MCE family protein [Mycobacteroides chelonae]
MPNSFESDGRGPTDVQLFASGVALFVVAGLLTGLMLLKSAGRLNDYVRVVADLVNVGDGLPRKSDVKYHGILVGEVDVVTPAADGKPNFVYINLKSQYAKSIPDTATARVVPSNVFAVSSVQLVDRGPGAPVRGGAHIAEDTQLPTVLFQTTVSKLRDVLNATGRSRDGNTVGILAAVGAATDNRRVKLLTGGAQLNRLIGELNSIVATDTGASTVSALLNATEGLKQSAPELLDSLGVAVQPMRALVEKREQLTSLVSGGLHTIGAAHQAFYNHSDQLIGITSDLAPVIGSFADKSRNFVPAFSKLTNVSQRFMDHMWMRDRDTVNLRVNVSFTPSYDYTRADCPRYGELKGTSCFTAPELVVRPDLPEELLPQNYKVPPDLQPPRGTVLGPNGNLVAVGPPYVVLPGGPSLTDPNPPLPPWQPVPVPRVPGTADPGLLEPQPDVAPASFGGNVGPVGSTFERAQLSAITDKPASSSTQLLLGPLARGTTVTMARKELSE